MIRICACESHPIVIETRTLEMRRGCTEFAGSVSELGALMEFASTAADVYPHYCRPSVLDRGYVDFRRLFVTFSIATPTRWIGAIRSHRYFAPKCTRTPYGG